MKARLLAAFCAISLCAAAPARAQDDVAAFYKGKQLRFIVGSAAGGGYDLFARIVARHIVNHIPGNPNIIVQNQPAGRRRGDDQPALRARAPRTAPSSASRSTASRPRRCCSRARSSMPRKLIWLGSTNREAYVAFVWHTVPVASIAELTSKEVVVGATTPGTTMVDFPLLVNDVLGYKFKVVRGYRHAADQPRDRARRDPGHGGSAGPRSRRRRRSGSPRRRSRCSRNTASSATAELPDIPTMLELARSEPDRAAMRMLFARTEYGRPYFLPPDVPAARVQALRRAFDATMKDPGFVAEAAKLQLDVSPMTGEEVQALVGELAKTPPEIVARVRAALDVPAAK